MSKLGSWIARVGLPLLLGCTPVFAQDIDLYSGLNPASANPPTVLLVWDNAANTNANVGEEVCTQYADGSGAPSLGTTTSAGMEQCAMVNALLTLKNDADLLGRVKIGLMVFNKDSFESFNGLGLGDGNGQCGYLAHAPQLMDAAGVESLIAKIKAFRNSNMSNGAAVGTTMAEAWAMLNGNSNSCSGVNYSSVAQTATQCRDAVLIYIGNAFTAGNPVDGVGGADTRLKNELTSSFSYSSTSKEYAYFTAPIAVAGINTSGNTKNDYWADEWTRFMKRVSVIDSAASDKNVTTYTISVTDYSNQDQAQPVINYYSEMAKQGGGKSFLVDVRNTSGLSDAILSIFNDVQARNSVFASATLPVTANTQGTYLNQVFVAMFRPDDNANPRWYGNLKQYQLGLDAGGNIVLTDSTETDLLNATSKTNSETGAISPNAVSFWTEDSTVTPWPAEGFWRNSGSGEGLQSDKPDGDMVEKGGAAQMARRDILTATYADSSNDNSRNLLTCNSIGGCSSGFSEFSTANSTLMTNALGLFGVGAASSYTGTLTAGTTFTTQAQATCDANKDRICTFSAPSDSWDLNAGDIISNSLIGTLDARCGMPSAVCTVDSVLGNVFTFTKSNLQTGATYTLPDRTLFHRADRSVTVDTGATAHGLKAGDSVILKSCQNTSDSATVYGLSGLPTSSSRSMVVTSATTNTFTFKWDDPAMTLPGANVSCTFEPALTASNLINWVRGWDIAGNEELAGPGAPITVRPSLQGDVLHSRPAVINYGGSTGVVVFYGSNDGVFRAINGNQNDSISGIRPGGEMWGFIAPEFHGKFKRLFQNSPLVDIPGVMDPNRQPKDYFFDGSTTVLRDTRTGTTTAGKTYIYLTARRGGRLIYALDVSDPMNPEFLWSKDESDMPELGQTWSQPKVALLNGLDDPVLIMGAGYAPEQDADPVVAADTMGRGVLILNAVTGDVVQAFLADCSGISNCVQTAGLTHSIAADVTLLDRSGDGRVDRVYAADTGANIWRIDFEPRGYDLDHAPSEWKITKLAALGGAGNDARKFLFAPDVIPTSDFDAVMAVSGDREHPLYTDQATAGMAYNVQNRIYMVKDRTRGSAMDDNFVALTEADLIANPDSSTFDATASTVNGFYINLPNRGEKGVNAPLTVAGKTYFGTNYPDVPNANSCTADLGFARAYMVSFKNAKVLSTEFVGGGLPPSPVSGLVNITGEPGNNTPFCIGCAGPTPFDPSTPDIDLNNNRKRAYWYAK